MVKTRDGNNYVGVRRILAEALRAQARPTWQPTDQISNLDLENLLKCLAVVKRGDRSILAKLAGEVTAARLAVNDWHACATQDELDHWRAAQQRLIEAATALGVMQVAPPSGRAGGE